MVNSIQLISHQRFGKLRAVVLDGKIWFVAKDVAQALDFKNTDGAIRKHVKAKDKISFYPPKTGDQIQNVNNVKISHNAYLINESGLWCLVMRSHLEKAQEFQDWITSEVIPSIMRNGYYFTPSFREGFSKREKVDILVKILESTDSQEIKNKIVEEILTYLK